MVTEPEGTPESTPPESNPEISRKSVLGFIALALFCMVASVRSDEEQPTWAGELPGRISPPLEVPKPPLGQETLAGLVLDSEEHPVADALVTTNSGEILAWNYTDADGRFILEGLSAGEVLVRVIGDGHNPQDFSLVGPQREVKLQLSTPLQEPPSLPELQHVDVTGVVTAPRADWGLEGYELWLEPMSPAHEFGAPLASRAMVLADRSVSFKGLIAGRYRAALLPPWARMGTWPNLLDPETPVIDLGLSEKSHLELKVVAGEIEGTVIDDRGRLVIHALVGVHPDGEPNQIWPPTRTDEHGHFVLRDLPVGAYVLRAHAGDLSVEHLIQMPGSSTLQVDLSLRR